MGVFITLFASSSAEEEKSLSEDVAASRLVREAAADPRKKKSRKAKKNRARKGGKNSRKARKGKKSKKNRKNKGKKKNSRKARKGKKRKERVSGRSVDAKCIAQLTLSMRRWKDVVTNFQRQSKRITDNKSKGDGKSGKKGVFGPIASKLVSSGGGNKSALTCQGSSSSDGAVAITKLAKDLNDCEKSVNDSCNPANFPAHNETLVTECTTLTDKFAEEAQKCMVKSKDESTAAEGCTCWTDPALVQLTEDVNKCKVKDAMDAIKAQLKACTKAFGACRKLEDAAVESLSACTADPAALKKKAAALSANKDAMGNVKTKLTALTGTRRSRVIRAPATTCAGAMDLVSTLLALVEEFPSAPTLLDLAKDIVDSPDVTCIDEEKASLLTSIETVDSIVEEMAETLDTLLSDIEFSEGSTPSTSELEEFLEETTAAPVMTTASMRKRRMVFQGLKLHH